MQPRPVTTDLVLLGAGHAHVEVLRRHAMRPWRGVRLTLIAREPHTPYSGMLPGLIRGEYDFDAAHIDCATLAAAAGAPLILADAEGIDLEAARVVLRFRPPLAYDLLSINVGGVPDMPAGAGGIPVKPIGRFLAKLAEAEAGLAPGARLAVVGGGAGGAELALALARRLAGRARLVLVAREGVLTAAPPRARRIVAAALAAAGVEVIAATATALAEGQLHLADGGALPVAAAIWATGAVAPAWLAASGLACDAAGCVLVAPTLQSLSHATVFAAGDCAAIAAAPRPKSGVWAVRAGAKLAENLARAAAGRRLRPWRPQRAALAILGLGDGRAVAWRNGLALNGRLAWRWKQRIDRRWMAMYQRPRTGGFMRRYRIAAIPADGIGPEVIDAGLQVLDALAFRAGFALDVERYDWGSAHYRRTGAMMPADGLAQIRDADAIYFGAVGAPDIPDHITLWGLRLAIAQNFDQYANIRPTRILPGTQSPLRDLAPGDLDWLIVRENSEGEYAGVGGRAHRGLPEEVATEVAVFTRTGIARIMRYAFAQARRRARRHLTVVTKSNAQRHGLVLWDEIAAEVAREFPDVTWDKELVDAMTVRMVRRPASLDTIVATNLHADILSDLAAALAGSIGIAPTGNIDPERRFPSMFEPIHGAAFDITGKGIANPVGAFWTASLMLEHLGEGTAAAALMAAVEQVCAAGIATPDLGGRATTEDVTRAVCEALRGTNLPAA